MTRKAHGMRTPRKMARYAGNVTAMPSDSGRLGSVASTGSRDMRAGAWARRATGRGAVHVRVAKAHGRVATRPADPTKAFMICRR